MRKLRPVGITNASLYLSSYGPNEQAETKISFSIENDPQIPDDAVLKLNFNNENGNKVYWMDKSNCKNLFTDVNIGCNMGES